MWCWGGYLDLAYRPNRYYEGGVRGDSTRLPFPQDGQESAISAYVTRFLTEQTSLRLQVRHVKLPDNVYFYSRNLIFNLQQIKFEQAGLYSIDVIIDEEMKCRIPLQVVVGKKEK